MKTILILIFIYLPTSVFSCPACQERAYQYSFAQPRIDYSQEASYSKKSPSTEDYNNTKPTAACDFRKGNDCKKQSP